MVLNFIGTCGYNLDFVFVTLSLSLMQFLERFDTDVIPRDYPEVSSKAGDRTTLGALSLTELEARLIVFSPAGWRGDPDRELVRLFAPISLKFLRLLRLALMIFIQISRDEVDYPETGNFKPEELHDYPPRIVCRFYPEDHTPQRTACTLSFTGFHKEVKIIVPLKAPKPQRQVDTRILQVY